LQLWCWRERDKSKKRFDVATRVCFWVFDSLWVTHLQCFKVIAIVLNKLYRTVDTGTKILLVIWRSDAQGCSSSTCRIALSIASRPWISRSSGCR
jgi:hypothetical protein